MSDTKPSEAALRAAAKIHGEYSDEWFNNYGKDYPKLHPEYKRSCKKRADIADIIERETKAGMLAELAVHTESLVSVIEDDLGMEEYADDASVGSQEINGVITDLPMTFGHIRRVRAILAKLKP